MPSHPANGPVTGPVECISAVTLATVDMASACSFYEALGFERLYGGPDAPFTSYRAGSGFVNLQLDHRYRTPEEVWGRAIFWVDDVDAMYDRVVAAGIAAEMAPSDAPWGERYFHVRDPDGHELSFARLLDR
jgi:catechol 2,3-dioxygenase-like lactoylglutathione lyase family enzyme